MATPRDILSQLLSPAQAATLDALGAAAWNAALAALQTFSGTEPAAGPVEARLVMPDEILADFADDHFVVVLGIHATGGTGPSAYVVVPTEALTAYLGAGPAGDRAAAIRVLAGQVVDAINAAAFAPAALTIALGVEDVGAGTMPLLLERMDEPALFMRSELQGGSTLPFSVLLPGSFLDALAAAVPADPAAEPDSAEPAVPFVAPPAGLAAPEEWPAAAPAMAFVGAPGGHPARDPMPEPTQILSREPQRPPPGPAAHRAVLSPIPDSPPSPYRGGIDILAGLQMNVVVELGRTQLTVSEVLGLGPGAVIELDRLAGEPVDILVNDRLIARGEVVVVDENFGVRVVEVVRRGGDVEERAG